jgi:hypothetical protein
LPPQPILSIGYTSFRPFFPIKVKHDQVETSRWSYYDEYLKSNKIKKARSQFPDLDAIVVDSINAGEIPRAMDLRDQLPTVCGAPIILKRFAEGKLSLKEAHERAVDSGADSVPYKKASAFRRWITQQDVDATLAGCPVRVREKLLYALEKIAVRIAALKKKHS